MIISIRPLYVRVMSGGREISNNQDYIDEEDDEMRNMEIIASA